MRFFTTEGPVNCADHYCLPPLERLDLPEVLTLIDQKKYFLLHAPRQTGKTTCLLALAAYLNREGCYRAVYANIESAQAAGENVILGMTAVVEQIARGARDQIGDHQATTRSAQAVGGLPAVVSGEFGKLGGALPVQRGWSLTAPAGLLAAHRQRRRARRARVWPGTRAALPNVPWEACPPGALPTSNRIFNSAVVPFGDAFAGVFRCADAPTGRIALYYGCADTVTGLAFCQVDEVLQFLKENSEL